MPVGRRCVSFQVTVSITLMVASSEFSTKSGAGAGAAADGVEGLIWAEAQGAEAQSSTARTLEASLRVDFTEGENGWIARSVASDANAAEAKWAPWGQMRTAAP